MFILIFIFDVKLPSVSVSSRIRASASENASLNDMGSIGSFKGM